MNDTFLSVDFSSSIEQETKFISCYAKLSLIDIVTEKEIKIGYASLYFINVSQSNDWNEVVYLADSIDGDLYSIVEGLTKVIEEEEDFFGLLAILNSIKIEKKFRGQGYGTKAFEEIVNYLEILSIDYIALRPFPFEEENKTSKKNTIKKLVKFYKGFDLKVVKKESETQLIMGRNLNYL